MSSMALYSFPAFLALAIKIWLVIKSDKRNFLVKNWALALFFLAVSIFNLIEVTTYLEIAPAAFYDQFIRWYTAALFLALASMLILSIRIANIKLLNNRYFIVPFLGFTAIIIGLNIFTDLLVAGYEKLEYGFTRIAGEFYSVMLLFALAFVILSFVFLLSGSIRGNREEICKKRCQVLMYSFLPFMLCMSIIIVLMQMGFNITGAVIFPLTTTYLLLILIFTETEQNLFNILIRIPYTPERRALSHINDAVIGFLSETSAGNKMNLKNLSNDIENKIVALVINQSHGSQINAAEILGISASSVTRKKRTTAS